jgi:hypothetical protein
LSEMLLNPIDMYGPGICDQYLSGFMNQVSQAVDDSVTEEVTTPSTTIIKQLRSIDHSN